MVLAAIVVYGWVAAYSRDSFGFSDSVEYLFMADFYRAWLYGGDIAQYAGHYGSTRYPPLFPLLLAGFGAGPTHPQWANGVSCLVAILAALAVWRWTRRDGALGRYGLWIAAAFLFYPAYFLLNLNVVSEPLAIGFLAWSFALLGEKELTRSRLLLASMLIGVALLARTALLPAVPALVFWMWRRRGVSLRWQAMAVALAAGPIVLWLAYRSTLKSETYLDSLSWADLVASAGAWPDLLWVLPGRLVAAVVSNWGTAPSALAILASTLLIALGAAGALIRLRRNDLDAWFLGGYVAMILIWPFPEEISRFLVVVYPCLLLAALTAARSLDSRVAARWGEKWTRGLQLLLVGTITLTTLATAVAFARRATVPVDPELLGEKREAFFFLAPSPAEALRQAEIIARARLLAETLREQMPPGSCAYSVFPGFVKLHGKTDAIPYPGGIADAATAKARLTRCDYYFQAGFGAGRGAVPNTFFEGWTQPVMVSNMESGTGPVAAAALLVRTEAADAAAQRVPPDSD